MKEVGVSTNIWSAISDRECNLPSNWKTNHDLGVYYSIYAYRTMWFTPFSSGSL